MKRKVDRETLIEMIKDNEDVTNVDTSEIKNMERMFTERYTSSFNQDISGWDVSNVKNMSCMFAGCESFNQDISGWDVSNVKNMSYMFDGCSSFNQDLSGWDVKGVENMYSMFGWCKLFNQDISLWNVSNVTDMSCMFDGCSSFNQDLSGWDVSNVKDMSEMFYLCVKLNQDLSGWDVSNVIDMSEMFEGCEKLNQDFSKWDVFRVGNENGITIINWDIENQGIKYWVDIEEGIKNLYGDYKLFIYVNKNAPTQLSKFTESEILNTCGDNLVYEVIDGGPDAADKKYIENLKKEIKSQNIDKVITISKDKGLKKELDEVVNPLKLCLILKSTVIFYKKQYIGFENTKWKWHKKIKHEILEPKEYLKMINMFLRKENIRPLKKEWFNDLGWYESLNLVLNYHRYILDELMRGFKRRVNEGKEGMIEDMSMGCEYYFEEDVEEKELVRLDRVWFICQYILKKQMMMFVKSKTLKNKIIKMLKPIEKQSKDEREQIKKDLNSDDKVKKERAMIKHLRLVLNPPIIIKELDYEEVNNIPIEWIETIEKKEKRELFIEKYKNIIIRNTIRVERIRDWIYDDGMAYYSIDNYNDEIFYVLNDRKFEIREWYHSTNGVITYGIDMDNKKMTYKEDAII